MTSLDFTSEDGTHIELNPGQEEDGGQRRSRPQRGEDHGGVVDERPRLVEH